MTAIRVAYADPPYMGQSKKHYGAHEDFGGEVDHPQLIRRLCDEFPDGWALSMKSNSLRELLPLCPPDTRVGIWTKTFAVFKKNNERVYAWEPVLVRGGRRPRRFILDYMRCPPSIRSDRFVGAKPEMFCVWLFEFMGLEPDDELVDLYPGTGGVSEAWESWRRQPALFADHAGRFEDTA